jgi:TetR/AcrR family transcriptional repressor of nem operon
LSKGWRKAVATLIHDNYHDWMKVDRSTRDAHRVGLLAAGSRLFRARGVDGVSLAEVSAEAGLTHGAFYGHYASKAALAEAACRVAATDAAALWRHRADQARAVGHDPLGAIIDSYLTPSHCDDPGRGCVLAALSTDAGRPGNGAMAEALTDMAHALVAILSEELAQHQPSWSVEARTRAGRGALAAMQGGMILARTLRHGPGGAEAAREMLDAARWAARQALAHAQTGEAHHRPTGAT